MLRKEINIVLIGDKENQDKFIINLKESLSMIAPLCKITENGFEAILGDFPINVIKTSPQDADTSVNNIGKAASIITLKYEMDRVRRDFSIAASKNQEAFHLGGVITADPYACIQAIAAKNGKKLPDQKKAEVSIPPLPVVINDEKKSKSQNSFFAEFKKIKNAFALFDQGLANKINEQNAKAKVQNAKKPDVKKFELN